MDGRENLPGQNRSAVQSRTDEGNRLAKKSLRREVKSAVAEFLSSTDAADLAELTGDIYARTEALPQFAAAHTILIYSSLPDEVDTSTFISRILGDKRVVLPLVSGNDLLLKELRPEESLAQGYMGIYEPSSDAPDVQPQEIDFAVIPGVAFTRDGWRLGRGRGFYDRLLPQLHAYTVAAAYPAQIVPSLPCDPWDVKLDCVIFPEQL